MNEITLPVSQLKAALPGFSKIIGRRASLPVLAHLRLTRDRDGGVNLTATDLDSHACYHIVEPPAGAPLDLLVPFEPLCKLVKWLGNQEVLSVIPDGKNKLKLRYPLSGSLLEQKLETLPAEEFPPLPSITQPDIQMGPEFGLAIKQALACCTSESGRPELRGVYVDVSDKKLHYIVASNGTMLFAANSFAFDLPRSILIPDSKFLNWTELMAAGCKLAVEPPPKGATQGFIRLASDRWTFITREPEARFPNWKQCVPAMAKPATVIQLSAPAVKQLLEVLPQLPGNNEVNRTIRLNYEREQLQVEGPSPGGEWTGVVIAEAVSTGRPGTMALNREYLITALKFNLNEIQIENALLPLVCTSGGRRLVIMPVKLDPPATAKPVPIPSTPTPMPAPMPAEERKTDMPETTQSTEPSALDQVEAIKAKLRELLGELNSLTSRLKQADKDKRNAEKEVASVRQTIRSLQGMKI